MINLRKRYKKLFNSINPETNFPFKKSQVSQYVTKLKKCTKTS